MVDKYEVSADKLTWTFTLRDGLEWHDGKPVTAEDCVASIKRWGAKDAMGQKLMTFVKDMPVVDAKTFRIVLKEPTGLVLDCARQAVVERAVHDAQARRRDRSQQADLRLHVGSGPFIFKQGRVEAGRQGRSTSRTTSTSRAPSRPRAWPAARSPRSTASSGVDIADQQTAVNALLAGEIDFIEQPPHDLLPSCARTTNVKLVDWNPLGNQYVVPLQHAAKPFDNPKIRQAALLRAATRRTSCKAAIGDPQYYKVCKALFVCGTPLASRQGHGRPARSPNFEKAQGAPQGGGLRRHADRAACTRPTCRC